MLISDLLEANPKFIMYNLKNIIIFFVFSQTVFPLLSKFVLTEAIMSLNNGHE